MGRYYGRTFGGKAGVTSASQFVTVTNMRGNSKALLLYHSATRKPAIENLKDEQARMILGDEVGNHSRLQLEATLWRDRASPRRVICGLKTRPQSGLDFGPQQGVTRGWLTL